MATRSFVIKYICCDGDECHDTKSEITENDWDNKKDDYLSTYLLSSSILLEEAIKYRLSVNGHNCKHNIYNL